MIRATAIAISAAVACALPNGLPGQESKPANAPQADPIARIVAEMRSAEKALKSIEVELATRGSYASGEQFSTQGRLHVLRGEQPKMHASFELQFANGLAGRQEVAQTAEGLLFYEANAAFGEVYVRIPPAVVADVQWAGEVLDRSDLFGMHDARAEAPLGSLLLDGLRRHFALAVTERTQRGADAGVWLAGDRRPGLGDAEDDLPLATRVEAFVRTRDHALLEVTHFQGDKELQHIDVKTLVVDAAIADAVFTVDGRGQTLRDVEKYAPLWSQIQEVVGRAETKLRPKDLPDDAALPPQCVRPSARK